MAAANSKSRTRRSMRVATVFTGVAAAAVGMTQAANAQAIRAPHAARPAGTIYGSIRQVGICGHLGIDPHFLHVSTTSYNEYGYFVFSTCFGFRGDYLSPSGTGIRKECGGDNHGFLDGFNNGRSQSIAFGPGPGYATINWSHLDLVVINSWTGTDACPQAPDYGDEGG
jgi:hypothetical protein